MQNQLTLTGSLKEDKMQQDHNFQHLIVLYIREQKEKIPADMILLISTAIVLKVAECQSNFIIKNNTWIHYSCIIKLQE